MFRILIIFFILTFYSSASSSTNEKVISQMQIINNLSFNFIQTINDKEENGKCIIKYPKKIFCEYENSNKKILISDGKSLVIKTINSDNYYTYPLSKTPLELLLDKNLVTLFNNVIYKNLDAELKADKMEIDLITKNSKIFMNDSSDKINIVSIN